MRYWLALAVLALALTVGLSKADGQKISSGLNVVGYSITDVPPLRSDTEYQQCGAGWYEQINYTWDYEENLFADCGWDLFMLHYTGFIVIPDGVESVRFGIASDDGSDVTIDGVNFGGWYDKGCSMDYSDRVILPTNEQLKLDAWMYENGGGTCLMLFWQFNGDDQDWFIVPESAFSNEAITPTTTSSSSTTTTTSTTTTSSTTLAPTTTTTLPPTTTTVRPTTTTTSSTTTTTVTPTTTTELPTTTTSTVPIPQTTVAPLPVLTTTTAPTPTTSTSTSTTSTTTTTTTLPPVVVPPVVSPEVAVALATNPAALATITAEEATQVFEALVVDDLSEEQLVALVSAVQSAPVSVRKSFEASVNVFGGAVDTYVPIGSTVPVKTRRALIAITIMTSLMVIPTKRK